MTTHIGKSEMRVNVETRSSGQLWRQLAPPITVQAAQTLAAAAVTLRLGDQVRVAPAIGSRIDIEA